MIVLDTNVLSELMRAQAEPAVDWLDRQEQDSLAVTAVYCRTWTASFWPIPGWIDAQHDRHGVITLANRSHLRLRDDEGQI